MHNLLDDLRKAPTPIIVKSKTGILKAVKDVHLAVLKSSLGIKDEIDISNKVASLRRYALWLEDVTFETLLGTEESLEVNDRESLFSAAATLYEFAGNLSSDSNLKSIFQPPLNDWLRSAILSSFTPYQAHSSLIGRRIRGVLDEYQVETPYIQCHQIVGSTIAALVGREFHIAFTLSKRLDTLQKTALDALKEKGATNQEFLELDRSLAIGRVCGRVALGMLTGVPSLISKAIERLTQIKERTINSEDANRYWLSDRLLYLVRSMANASTHRILIEAKLPNEYRHTLARDNFLEFWGPQLRAIENGLLDSSSTKHFVISIPTGAGKTLFAELSLLTVLKGHNPGWAMYVTPSRALVNQVSDDLRQRLERCNINVRTIVAGAEQSEIFDEELDLLKVNRTVTVTTPEKLDAYYRNAQEIFDTCRLVIFDEVHKLSEPDRGPLVESLIARFLSLQPQTRILFLSGVMSNVEEMKSWLGEEDTIAITERSRPTRRVYGIAIRGQETVHSDLIKRKSGETLRRVEYAGGLVIVHEREDLEGDLQVNLPDIFKGFYHERLYPRYSQQGQWREDRKEDRSSSTDHASGLVHALAQAPGTILVFMQSIKSVQKACREFKYRDGAFQEKRERLASLIAAELGPSHPLSGYCRLGIAYHHARLPSSVQRAIELALDQGWLKVVFATTTLREGVNTAARTVVIAGHLRFDEVRHQEPMSEADFLNLAGRAGRPRTDTEGRVFFIPSSLAQATAVENGKKYILAGDAALRVKSQLAELVSSLNQPDNNLMRLPPMHQSILLSLEAAGLTDSNGITTFVDHSLWSLQEEDEEFIQATAGRIVDVIARAKSEIGDERIKVASRLGLSLSSSEQLRMLLMEKKELFVEDFFFSDRRTEQVTTLLLASLPLSEIRKGAFRKDIDPYSHVFPLLKWISGENYQVILDAAKESGVFSANDDVTEAVKYASDMSTWLSWAFGAAHSLLRSIISNVDLYIGILPLLVKYGVPTSAAAYISLLGVSDRTAAQMLGQHFEQMNHQVSLEEVSKWLTSIGKDEIEKILAPNDHGLRTEIVTRQVLRGDYRRSPYRISRINATINIPAGTILSTKLDKDELFLICEGVIAGKLITKIDLLAYPKKIIPLLVAVSISNVSRGHNGIVALVEPAAL